MTKVINHNILGELYYNNGWYKEIKLSLFGKLQKMGLIIEGDEDAQFENSQIEAYKEFMKNKDILFPFPFFPRSQVFEGGFFI